MRKDLDSVLGASRVFLNPGYVIVVRRRKNIAHFTVGEQGGHGAAIAPAMNFRVTVGEGKAAGEVMVVAGKIKETVIFRAIGPTGHSGAEIAHIDAVLSHIQEDKNFGGSRVGEFSLFAVDFVIAEGRPPIAVGTAPAAEEYVH